VGIFSPINVFVVTNMKNNFVATFILLAVGLIFNDVASVHGKPTKGNPNDWKDWQILKFNVEGTSAIYRCYGTFSDYKDPQECNRADLIKGMLFDWCVATDPIACELLSIMTQAEITANNVEAAKMVKRAGS
jgi:hypothetical protein